MITIKALMRTVMTMARLLVPHVPAFGQSARQQQGRGSRNYVHPSSARNASPGKHGLSSTGDFQLFRIASTQGGTDYFADIRNVVRNKQDVFDLRDVLMIINSLD